MSVIKPLFSAQTIDASGNATSANVEYTGGTNRLQVDVKNTGTSTSWTATIYGGSHKDKTFQRVLATFTLGTGTNSMDGCSIEAGSIPDWCWADVVNSDGEHTAIVSIELTIW